MYPVQRAVFVLAPLLALTLLASGAARGQEHVLDEIVAVVADDIVLKSEVDGLVTGVMQQQGMSYSTDVWVQALQQIIDQKVMAEIASRDTNIVITEEQVDQALDERIAVMTQQVGSVLRLEDIYGKPVEQIRTDLREDFRERLLAEQLQGTRINAIKITPTEVDRWFAQFPTDSLPTLPDIVRASHIVRYPAVTPEAEEEALEIISAIQDSILTGTSTLESMARRYSDDPGSASLGGHYEDMALGDLVPEFAAVVARIPEGELSAPFKSPFGYHVLRVEDRRGDMVDFSHVLINIDQSRSDPTVATDYLEAVRDSILTFELPFELLARRNSEERSSGEIGGRLIDPTTGERDLFVEALGEDWTATTDTLEIGEISMPAEVTLLDGSLAYHIVVVQRRVPEHRIDIETDYPRIEQLALEDKRVRELRRWLDGLRDKVFVDIRGSGAERLGQVQSEQ